MGRQVDGGPIRSGGNGEIVVARQAERTQVDPVQTVSNIGNGVGAVSGRKYEDISYRAPL